MVGFQYPYVDRPLWSALETNPVPRPLGFHLPSQTSLSGLFWKPTRSQGQLVSIYPPRHLSVACSGNQVCWEGGRGTTQRLCPNTLHINLRLLVEGYEPKGRNRIILLIFPLNYNSGNLS